MKNAQWPGDTGPITDVLPSVRCDEKGSYAVVPSLVGCPEVTLVKLDHKC